MTHTTTGVVLVVGGGIAGIQAALYLAYTGYRVVMAEQPFIIYRRSEAEMPASAKEIAECREEGIEQLIAKIEALFITA